MDRTVGERVKRHLQRLRRRAKEGDELGAAIDSAAMQWEYDTQAAHTRRLSFLLALRSGGKTETRDRETTKGVHLGRKEAGE